MNESKSKRCCNTYHERQTVNRTGTRRKEIQLKALEVSTEYYSSNTIVPLSSLKQGVYAIKALKECTRQHDNKFIMLLEKDKSLKSVIF